MLGIAFPHPDCMVPQRHRAAGFRGAASPGISVPLRVPDPALTLTPPEEKLAFTWPTALRPALPHSVHADQGYLTGGEKRRIAESASASGRKSAPTTDTLTPSHAEAIDSAVEEIDYAPQRTLSIAALDDNLQWLSPAVMAIATCIGSSGGYAGTLKVLSHALPMPSVPGHVYANIIDAIRAQCEPGQLSWINLMHAIPGRLNLADLPSSPPNTPAPPLDGDDYFTTKIFSSAVTTGYDEVNSVEPRRPTQRLLSPPGSIELSIIERYIPPVSKRETQNMFSLELPSVLVDRLVELSPHGGCLTFIYPTKIGGLTFLQKYLDPLLDPLLRTMMSLHGLSADFGNFVSDSDGLMANSLLEFPVAEVELADLCERLNRLQLDADRNNRFHGVAEGKYEIVYAEQREVVLDSAVWATWWKGQEKPRLTSAIARYFQRGNRLPKDEKAQQGVLVQELLDGVARQASQARPASDGIEVGVFVIKRG